jgi:hypothetical protein
MSAVHKELPVKILRFCTDIVHVDDVNIITLAHHGVENHFYQDNSERRHRPIHFVTSAPGMMYAAGVYDSTQKMYLIENEILVFLNT